MERQFEARLRIARWSTAWAIGLLAACGGGGGGDGAGPAFAPAASLAQQCAPSNPLAPAESRRGSLMVEKQWLRSHVDEVYLWYDEVPVVDPLAAAYSDTRDVPGSMDRYFEALKTRAVSSTGLHKDRYGYTYPTSAWSGISVGGQALGLGIEWALGDEARWLDLRIAFVEPGSPADAAGLRRGDSLRRVDGLLLDGLEPELFDALLDLLSPAAGGRTHRLEFSRAGGSTLQAALKSAMVTRRPVLQDKVLTAADGAQVGYIVFNDHSVPAEQQLVDAVNRLKARRVTDLVLDLRYNGGGLQYIASQLAYMIAGRTRTEGRVFQRTVFSAKRAAEGADPRASTPFHATTCPGYDCGAGLPLPSLDLPRVYVLATGATCSASEAVINGLRGVGVEVRMVGETTCGKPYGFRARDNCGISYFAVEFKGVNDRGFGEYESGFVPGGAGSTGVPGCAAVDDLNHALGDPAERLLKVALDHRATGRCPVGTSARPMSVRPPASEPAARRLLQRHPTRANLVLSDTR